MSDQNGCYFLWYFRKSRGFTVIADACNFLFSQDLIKKEFGSIGAPTHNLPAMDLREKLFSGRNRLFVGNLPPNITREDVDELMAPYGEIVVDHHNDEKRFGFVRLVSFLISSCD